MNTQEATALIQSILDSITTNPAQFNFKVSVTTVGAVGIGGPGGAGIVGIAHGGGIGFQASASAPSSMQIQIAQQQANAEINAKAQVALRALESIVQELRNQSMSAAKRDGFIAQLKATWLPNVIVTLVGQILTAVVSG
jgi:hypothetical protein